MSVDERLRLAESIELEGAVSLYAAARAGHVERAGSGAAVWVEGIDDPMLNRAFGFDGSLALPELDRALDALGKNGRRYFVQVAPHAAPTDLAEWLSGRRLVRYRRAWAKFVRPTNEPPVPRTALTLRPATLADRPAFGALVSAAFHLQDSVVALLDGLFTLPGWHVFVGCSGDDVVAGGAVFAQGDAAWLGFGATSLAFRGRGAQSSILAARIACARDLGCRFVFTETGEAVPGEAQPSYRNIERAGFEVLYSRQNYFPRSE